VRLGAAATRARSHDENPASRCERSQNGFVRDAPQRHSATGRPGSTSNRLPSASTISAGPVTLYGPSPLDHPVTSGNLCIKGRFGFHFVQNDRGDLPPPLEEIPAGPPAPAEARDGHNGDGFAPRDSDPAG
jgi:hypothetical protein